MSTVVTVSVSEYLESVYRPDCEYIDGELRERNLGEFEHSNCQMYISNYLYERRKQCGIIVLPALRTRISSTRYRVPDITVIAGPRPSTPILREPPFLCVEILSREDRAGDLQERIDDYLSFGVPHVWIVNPLTLRAYHHTLDGMREAKDGILRTTNPDIAVPLLELELA